MPDPIETLKALLTWKPDVGHRWSYGSRDPLDAIGNPDLPAVPHPPMFRQGTPATNPELGKAIRALEQIAPDITGRAKMVSYGPSTGAISTALKDNYPVERLPMSNLLGMYGMEDKNMFINPRLKGNPPDLFDTLAHEFGHATGKLDGNPEIEQIEDAARQVFSNPQMTKRK